MDGDSPLPLLLLFLFFLLTNAFFSSAETAFSTVSRVRLRCLADDGNRRAARALYVLDSFDDALTTLLIGINISSIAAASIATVIAVETFRDVPSISTYSTLVTTVILFFFAEMVPKALANDRSETVALGSAGILRFCMRLFYPLVVVFRSAAHLATRLFGKSDKPSITEEELYDIIETIGEEGVVDEEQTDLLKSAMDFSETTAGDVMTMRDDIFWLDIGAPKRELLDALKTTNHSRIPVCDGDLDHLIGLMPLRWFFKNYLDHRDGPVRKYIRKNLTKPYFVRKDAKIDELLETMRQHKIYMAFVTDEKKHILGLVTIEDFLEELVGEIWDEDDVVDERFYGLGGNRYEADPSLTLAEAMRRMKRPLRGTPLAPDGAKTLREIVTAYLGETPEEESAFIRGGYEFTAEETDDAGALSRVVIRICEPDELTAGGGDAV